MMHEQTCPICNSDKTATMLNLECCTLDSSPLYPIVKIKGCNKCGHVYNLLTPTELEGLTRYYNDEYAPLNPSATDKTRFRKKRYTDLYRLIASVEPSIALNVLDVGCATGGFLEYLHKQGFKHLYGIEIIEDYVKLHCNVEQGSAESIPFEDNTIDLLVLDQVLEHLVDPVKAFREAKRVLVDDGLLCIGVPDAARYNETYFFDFYWFLLREHIHHFDIEHLKLLAEGFELVAMSKIETPLMSDKMVMPNLNAVFRLTDKPRRSVSDEKFKLKEGIERYIANESHRRDKKIAIIDSLAKSQKPVYIWGIGREFHYLYESAGLKKCNIVGLIDTNPYKQRTFTVDNIKIEGQSILEEATLDSSLIITAIAHTNEIEVASFEMGFQGHIVET
jgi:SAM-dependent methyltransferase